MTLLFHDPIRKGDRGQMVDYLLAGAKPRAEWRTGLELELIGFRCGDLARIEATSIKRLLREYSDEPIVDAGSLVGAHGAAGSLTIEPGGQVEFSGVPRDSLINVERDLRHYVDWLKERARELGIMFLGVGFDPLRSLEEQSWVEKRRYALLRPYLQTRGRRGLDMMTRTASIQVNLDYSSEEDLARKFVVGNRLAPIVGAIFANSPFREGRLSGARSERALVWLETDAARSGVAPPALGDHFSLDDWIDYILSTPMLFVRRDEVYRDMTHLTFGEFLSHPEGCVEPVFGDFTDHLTTIFTEARLKQWIELRSADSGSLEESLAVQALWKGLMYDSGALEEAFGLMPCLTSAEYLELQQQVAHGGLSGEARGIEVLGLARSLVELALGGLKAIGAGEEKYLEAVADRVIRQGVSPADILIRNFEGAWHGRMSPVIDYLRVA